MRSRDDFISHFQVRTPVHVQWGDMDAFNHVNNVMYFRYFESSRIDYFQRVGLNADISKQAVGPILAETHCRFRVSLRYPDKLEVGARVMEIQEHGFLMQYAIFSNDHDSIAAIGTGRIVLLDYNTGDKVTPDTQLLNAINKLETVSLA